MRNLKKILALVLALVMSLSLMAVASADDELNLGDVSDVYAESVDVLTGLKVFMGNKGEFLPKDNITRAEVAAIIYRIVTGDVTNSQNGIYADYNKFSDVTSDAWYAGYVNYCANAEYVKGVGYDANGKAMFKPQQNVTGYEALAMILRAIGYDRNNEFTGPSWQIQTAATARNRGILVNIQEGTLGTAATREAVAEILCKTILVPVADYSLAFGYRTTDANGKDNETLAYKTFKMEKIDGVVMANEYASLTASTPLPAGQTTLGERTLNVTSTLDDIGESRYVYVIPQTGSARYDLVTTKTYDTGLNQVYDNEGAKVASVGDSTGSANGITSIAGAQHFINFEEIQEWTAAWRLEYVLQVKMSEYDAKTMYYENGTLDNSSLRELDSTANAIVGAPNDAADSKIVAGQKIMARPTATEYRNRTDAGADNPWSQVVENLESTNNPNGYTYEYRKVIPAGTKLTPTDISNIQAIFNSANRVGTNFIQGEVYAGTNTTNSSITITGTTITTTADLSDRMNYDQFVADYLKGTDNKRQVTSNGLGQHLKIVDNNNDGIAEYVLQTIYTVAIVNANGGLDIANVEFSHNNGRDDVNQVASSTKVVNDGEGELATGNVVIYALIDGNARAQLAATETVKINTVNRAAATATATGEDGKTWTESDVHTHSPNMRSGLDGMVGNTTYTLYFDLYGNLAAYTEGENGAFVLITDGWHRSALNGSEYAVRAYIDGSFQTVELTAGGNLFVSNGISNNTWGQLKTVEGLNVHSKYTNDDDIHTFVANLDGSVITPVDKMYNYIRQVAVIDTDKNAVPNSTNVTVTGNVRPTVYTNNNDTAYNGAVTTAGTGVRVAALSNTTYYYVFKNSAGNTEVRTFTGYNSVPNINAEYIEDVYVVGTAAKNAVNTTYYTADVVVVELTDAYNTSAHRAGEPVFVPDFHELTDNLGYEQVTMIRSTNGAVETLKVNMAKSNLDWYDTTGNLVRDDRRPGLFYLSEDPARPGEYTLQRMTSEQIRGENSIFTGFINRSSSTQLYDYATVDLMSLDGGSLVRTGEMTGNVIERRAQLTEASKYYTLAYTNSTNFTNIADLKESDAATVLAQTKARNANDNCPSWENEQLNAPAGYNPEQWNLNEVLVFANGGKIVFAVSFNEYRTGTTHDYAQTVWANCLPSVNEPSNVSFYNVGNGDAADIGHTASDSEIHISYADAAKINPATGKVYPIVAVTGTNVQSWTLEKVDTTTTLRSPVTNNAEAPEKWIVAPEVNGARYVLTINYYNQSAPTTYTLIQDRANHTGMLIDIKTDAEVDPAAGAAATNFKIPGAGGSATVNGPVSTTAGTVIANNTPIANLTLKGFTTMFRLEGVGATVEWTFLTADGKTITEPTEAETMQNVIGVRAIVKDQTGVEVARYTAGTINAVKYTVTIPTSSSVTVKNATGTTISTSSTSGGNDLYTLYEGERVVFVVAGDKTFVNKTDDVDIATTYDGTTTSSTSVIFTVNKNVTIDVVDNSFNVTTVAGAGVTKLTPNAGTVSVNRNGDLVLTVTLTTAANNNIRVVRTRSGNVAEVAVTVAGPDISGNYTVTIPASEILASDSFTVTATNKADDDSADDSASGDQDVRYSPAYTAAGLTFTKNDENKTITVNVDRAELTSFIAEAELAIRNDTDPAPANKTYYIDMLGGHGNANGATGPVDNDGRYNYDYLWAGVAFDAPATATGVSINGGAVTAKAAGGTFDSNGQVHAYYAVARRAFHDSSILDANNTNSPSASQYPLQAMEGTRTLTRTLQFYTGTASNWVPLGSEQTWTVNINFN